MATKTVRAPMPRSRRAKQFQPFDALSQICDKASYHEKIVIIKCSKIAGGIKNKHRNFPDNLPHQAVSTFDVSLNNKCAPK